MNSLVLNNGESKLFMKGYSLTFDSHLQSTFPVMLVFMSKLKCKISGKKKNCKMVKLE